jgi:quercetin dioxygenase-like cupin family protein
VYVLDGEVEHTLGEQRTILRAGDLIVVPRNVPHRLINASGTACKTLIVFSAPDRVFSPTGR